MKHLPGWVWLVVIAGVAVLVGGAFVNDNGYVQSVMVEVGATSLLVVPIVLAERTIVDTLRRRLTDAAAVGRTEEMIRVDDFITHFGQALGSKLPPTRPDHLLRMLGAEGWVPARSHDGYQLWRKGELLFAVPEGNEPLQRGVVLGVSRYARWKPERYIELWNVTRPEGAELYVPGARGEVN